MSRALSPWAFLSRPLFAPAVAIRPLQLLDLLFSQFSARRCETMEEAEKRLQTNLQANPQKVPGKQLSNDSHAWRAICLDVPVLQVDQN